MTADAVGVSEPDLLALVQVFACLARFPAWRLSIGPSNRTSEKQKGQGGGASESARRQGHGSSHRNRVLGLFGRSGTYRPFEGRYLVAVDLRDVGADDTPTLGVFSEPLGVVSKEQLSLSWV